jgi:hypothetical protein
MRQVFKQTDNWGARVLGKRGTNTTYDNIPKFWEWLTINYVMNATRDLLLRFYIFKSEGL